MAETSITPLLCLTVTAYRNPALNEDEYREYMTKVHAPLVSGLMQEYGILRYNMVCVVVARLTHTRKKNFTQGFVEPQQQQD